MNYAALLLQSQPTITAAQVMLALAIAGGAVYLIRLGILIGEAVKTIREMPAMWKDLNAKVERLTVAVEDIVDRLGHLERARG